MSRANSYQRCIQLHKPSKHNNHRLPSNTLCSTDNQSTYFHRLFSFYIHGLLSAVTHAPYHASMLRPASQAGPMHESAGVGKLVNDALLSLINEACMNVCCATLLSSELVGPACV